jgi:hypothetical protein
MEGNFRCVTISMSFLINKEVKVLHVINWTPRHEDVGE